MDIVYCMCSDSERHSHPQSHPAEGFQGILVLPGKKSAAQPNPQHNDPDTSKQENTWLDQVLGPTFYKLIRALNIEKMSM